MSIVLLTIAAALVLWSLTSSTIPTDPAPRTLYGLPAADGWRPDTAWTSHDGGLALVNALGWEWNANPQPIGTDREWLPDLPEWIGRSLHPFGGLGTL